MQHFKDVVRLAQLDACLEEQAYNPGETPPHPITEKMLTGIKTLKEKVNQLALGTANLESKHMVPGKLFADAMSNNQSPETQNPNMKLVVKGKKKPFPQPQLHPTHLVYDSLFLNFHEKKNTDL